MKYWKIIQKVLMVTMVCAIVFAVPSSAFAESLSSSQGITRTLTLDTRSYEMAPGNIYDFRAVLNGSGLNQNTLKVYSSRSGIASVSKIGGTNKYRVKAIKAGVTYIMAEISGVHASIKITVANGIKQHGVSARSISVIPEGAANAEMRAVWVPYMSLAMYSGDQSEAAFKQKYDTIIAEAKKSGMNTLMVHVRPFGDALYPSKLFPWSHLITGTQGKNPGFDPLAYMIEATHNAGMEFHAWINPLRIQITNNPVELSADNPYNLWKNDDTKADWTMDYQSEKYYNPGFAEVRNYLTAGVKEIVQSYQVDGIHFDDYFYPTEDGSIDKTAYQKSGTNLKLDDWRRQNINLLVSQVYKEIKAIKPEVQFGISPQANIQNDMKMGADIKTWATVPGYVDYLCPQIYFSFDHSTMPFMQVAQTWNNMVTAPNVKLYLGLGLYKAGTTADGGTWLKSNDNIMRQIQYGRNLNTDGFVIYSYEYLDHPNTKTEMANVISTLN